MKIPKYWASETQHIKDSHGHPLLLKCWRWSDDSLAAAQAAAHERINTVAQTLHSVDDLERYGYGDRQPLREEIIKTITDETIITRNAYGSLVLNTARVMFIDIDLKEAKAGLFGQPPDVVGEARARIEKWVNRNPGWGMRVYRTKAGLRCIATHDLFDPEDSRTQTILKELESDPLYVTLCRAQKCFRARLTPKHWRCDIHKRPPHYPYENAKGEERHQRWVRFYEETIRNYAVCELVAEFGDRSRHPEVESVIAVHDDYALRAGKLALA